MSKTALTDAELLELAKNPEMRAELAVRQAKTQVHLVALVAEAIRDAVKQDRAEATEILAKRMNECFCAKEPDLMPCQSCYETSSIMGMLKARSER